MILFNKKLINDLQQDLAKYKQQIQEAKSFISLMKEGEHHVSISEELKSTPLGKALLEVQQHLAKISAEEKDRNWLNVGLANFSDVLRNKQSLSLQALTDDILKNVVNYVGANQGAIFTLENEGQADEHLSMISCYAYSRKKFLGKTIGPGEGLAGQCLLEKQTIYVRESPADYVNITSGLGSAPPREILICPLLVNEKAFGVLELASFEVFTPNKIAFIEKLSESIGSTIKNVKESERVLTLLNASQQQAEELRAQEEEIRQNMEELQATQEEVQRRAEEMARASAEMTSIWNGINATMATIEFTPEGNVITANANFLKVMKYRIEEVKGKHHRKFVPAELLQSDDYLTFWSRLAAGESFSGIFKRIAGDGKIVWLNAIYNPILDGGGKVIKVVKFATDITAQQESQAENAGVLDGINATMATIEFTPDGTIISANENFLKCVKYRIDDIRGKHHKMFVDRKTLMSPEYQMFWKKLATGESIKGTFNRVDALGNTVWLNAIYNPIADAAGKIIKVVKFATDITAQQEMLAESQGIINGINATMATIEFTPDGKVISANDNFLGVMKYALTDIQGKHHQMFVPYDIVDTDEYRTFWKRLAEGEPINGIFKRITADGKVVWLNAVYNPIVNAEGEVSKVIKFATDITASKTSDVVQENLVER